MNYKMANMNPDSRCSPFILNALHMQYISNNGLIFNMIIKRKTTLYEVVLTFDVIPLGFEPRTLTLKV